MRTRACATPSRRPLIRMLETVFAEKDEHRASRRQFTEDSIAKAYGKNAGAPAASCTGGCSYSFVNGFLR